MLVDTSRKKVWGGLLVDSRHGPPGEEEGPHTEDVLE